MESSGHEFDEVAERLAGAEQRLARLARQNKGLRAALASAVVAAIACAAGGSQRTQDDEKDAKKDSLSDFRFTHWVKADTPYFCSIVQGQAENGTLLKGSQVMTRDDQANPIVIWVRAEINGGTLERLGGGR